MLIVDDGDDGDEDAGVDDNSHHPHYLSRPYNPSSIVCATLAPLCAHIIHELLEIVVSSLLSAPFRCSYIRQQEGGREVGIVCSAIA